MNRTATPSRSHRALQVLAVIAGGAWGSVAGGALFGLLAQALGAPTGTDGGEIIPGPGWNRFTAFILGLPVGLVLGIWGALRATRRWPRVIGIPVAVIGALVVVTTLIEPSLWEFTFFLLIVPTLPGVAFLMWRWRKGASHTKL